MRIPLVAALALGLAAAPASAEVGSYLLFDMATGEVIAAYDASHLWYPASITKLMTVFVTLEAVANGKLAMTSPVRMSAQASMQPPSKMGFVVGTVITVETAIRILMTKSANDVAVALAEAVGGTQGTFVDEMNAAAARLDMTSTHFDNPHGLPNTLQRTTARDLAVLMMALAERFPDHADLFAMTGVQLGAEIIPNHNNLMRRFAGADGMKTGFICASGFNVAVTARREGRRLGAVVLGGLTVTERDERAGELLAKGFDAVASGKAVVLDGFGDPADRLALAPVADPRPALGTVAALAAAAGDVADRKDVVCGNARPVTRYDDGTVEAEADVVAQRKVWLAAERMRATRDARRAIVLAMPRVVPAPPPAPELVARAAADADLIPEGWMPASPSLAPQRNPGRRRAPAPRREAEPALVPEGWTLTSAALLPQPSPRRSGAVLAFADAASAASPADLVLAAPAPVPAVEALAPAEWIASPARPARNPLPADLRTAAAVDALPPPMPLTYLAPPGPIVPMAITIGGADESRPAPLSGPIVGGGPPPVPHARPERPQPQPPLAGTPPAATQPVAVGAASGSEADAPAAM